MASMSVHPGQHCRSFMPLVIHVGFEISCIAELILLVVRQSCTSGGTGEVALCPPPAKLPERRQRDLQLHP